MKRSLVSFLIVSAVFASVAVAQTPSPTATDSSSIRDAVKAKVTEELNSIKKASTRKAYVGSISGKTDLTLTITNLRGQTRTATIVTDATIKLAGGKEGTVDDIKVGDFVIAMGDADGQGVLTVKRLLVISKPVAEKRETKSITYDGKTYKITASTKFTGTTKSNDIETGDQLVVIVSGTNILFAHKLN